MFNIVNQSLHFHQNLYTLRTTPYIFQAIFTKYPSVGLMCTCTLLYPRHAQIWNLLPFCVRSPKSSLWEWLNIVYIATCATFTSSSAIVYVSLIKLKKRAIWPNSISLAFQVEIHDTLFSSSWSPPTLTPLSWTNLSILYVLFLFC